MRLTDKRPAGWQDAGGTRERCDGIRQESMFEVRLFGAKQWVAVVEIKKRGAGRLPVFSFSVCRRSCRRHRRRRAPQKRCVNGCQNSRPGGVILPPLPCTSNYNFAFTPLLRSAQAKSLRAPQRETANHLGALLSTVRRISVPATTRPLASSRSVLRSVRLRRLMLCRRMSRSAMLLSHVLSRRLIVRRSGR